MKRYSQLKTGWLDVPPVVASTVAMGTTGQCHMTKDQPMGWWHWTHTHTESLTPCTLLRDVLKQTANSATSESRRKETFTLSSRSIHSNLSLSRSSWTRYAFESKAEEERLPHQQHTRTPHTPEDCTVTFTKISQTSDQLNRRESVDDASFSEHHTSYIYSDEPTNYMKVVWIDTSVRISDVQTQSTRRASLPACRAHGTSERSPL